MLAIRRGLLALAPALLVILFGLFDAGTSYSQDAQPLPEMTLGAAGAPVTIIEYASMSCSHCASFHADVYPQLKEKYIDTGKARFIFREFPLNAPAFQASVLARCGGPSRFFGFIDILFRESQRWAGSPDPIIELAQIGRLGGISAEKFQTCLQDKRITDGILKNRLTGEQEHKITSTPSFVINGQLVSGAQEIAEFEKLIEPLLKGETPLAMVSGEPASRTDTAASGTESGFPTWAIIIIGIAIAAAIGCWFAVRRRSSVAG